MVWNAKHCSTIYFAYHYRYGFSYYYALTLISILALSHSLCTCDEIFFFFLMSKFFRKMKEKEATKNHIEQPKSYEQ